MNRDDLINTIQQSQEIDIYYDYLLGQEAWVFKDQGDDYVAKYDRFRKFVSKKLDVPFNNVSIVGSAKTRYSFSPDKDFSEFDDDSDIDLIIVSDSYFGQLWRAYREISSHSWLKGYSKITSNIFNEFISLNDDDSDYGQYSLEKWQKKILSFKAELQVSFSLPSAINYRIYKNWEAVERYHLDGITKLKIKLNENN